MSTRIYTIYRATNTITGKVYIGFDSSWPKRRYEHKGDATRNNNYKFYNAIRKYGWNNFVWDPIYQSLDYDHTLNTMEQYFIDEYDSIKNGYNGRNGGGRGSLGSKWWNNGNEQIHTQYPPDNSYKPGRLEFNNAGALAGAAVNAQKFWVNNGTEEKMIFKTDTIPYNFKRGRLKSKAFNGYDRSTQKGFKWWNNGTDSKMSHTCPGPNYVQGRISTNLGRPKLQSTVV